MVKLWQEEVEFHHVYGEEKDIIWYRICHFYGKRKIYDLIPSCLWQRREYYWLWFWTRSWIPNLLCSFLPVACDWGPHEVDELFCWAKRPMVQRVPPRDDHHFGGAKKLRRSMSVKFSGTRRKRFELIPWLPSPSCG